MVRAIMIIGSIALLIGIIIYSFIDCIRTDNERVKVFPKPVWFLAILIFPLAGALLWLFFGKHASSQFSSKAPDNDEEFLKYLEARAKRQMREKDDKTTPPEDTNGEDTHEDSAEQ
ncbi:PLD nuclease N-terminal domain-containing protein [Rothia sp. CCM 9418]|uniref:PLD nuclease N-terminal domain-containing protein n=1 Tax=unclassified Rothia (in: high G+C Gram-positive bacteria) TaxID=2689056 RepID=UPI003AD30E01